MKKTKINYDKKKDVFYIVLREGSEESFKDISDNITVEYDSKERPIGIEIFKASGFLTSKLGRRFKGLEEPISVVQKNYFPEQAFYMIGGAEDLK